jgi:hypothetical protein
MNVSKKHLCLRIILSVSLSSLLWGSAEQRAERDLKFAPGPAAEWRSIGSVYGDDMRISPVEYAAVLRIGWRPGETIKSAAYLYAAVREGFGGRLEKVVSEEQKAFLHDYPGDTLGLAAHEPFVEVKLYAVSEADAQAMATACVEWMDETARGKRAMQEQVLERLRQNQRELTERISRLTEAENAIRAKLNDLKQATHYLDADEAAVASRRLNQEVQMLQIEFRGIEARIDAVEKERASMNAGQRFSPDVRSDVLSQLALLEVTENVNAAGVLARIQAARQARDLAVRYCELDRDHIDTRQKRKAEAGRLAVNQDELAVHEPLHSSPPFEYRAVELLQDTVLICPVEVNRPPVPPR